MGEGVLCVQVHDPLENVRHSVSQASTGIAQTKRRIICCRLSSVSCPLPLHYILMQDLIDLPDEDLDALGQAAGLDTLERNKLVNAVENTRKVCYV